MAGHPPLGEQSFLPLTAAAARSAADSFTPPSRRAAAGVVHQCAELVEEAAARCWRALLGGRDSPASRALPGRLRTLSEALAGYTGSGWWHGVGTAHRRRVSAEEQRVLAALQIGDAARFAAAFIGYDRALATAVIDVQAGMGSSPV